MKVYITEKDDSEWLLGDGAGDSKRIIRSMSDPHKYEQPAIIFLTWKHQRTKTTAAAYSLLNRIFWRLHEKGMPVGDGFFYWMNVIMAIVPGIDYPLLAKLLP